MIRSPRSCATVRDAAGDKAWIHVDAAHAGAALVCDEHRWMIEGIGGADSFCFNPHKWLLTNFDCDLLWTRDRESLVGALSITPEYLRNAPSESGGVVDFRDWQVPLGRRFRALKLWFVLRHYGLEGLRAHVRHGIAMAERPRIVDRRGRSIRTLRGAHGQPRLLPAAGRR